MNATFNGITLFGSPTTTEGPHGSYRAQREELPGVGGYRIYRLGGGPTTWTIRGRLTAGTLSFVKAAVNTARGYRNGQLYTFVDTDGSSYPNCELTDFRTVGNFEGITQSDGSAGVTVEVVATVSWASPT